MKFFLISFVFLLSLGQLQRIQLTNNLAFYLHDLLILGFVLKELFARNLQIKIIVEKAKKIPKNQKKIFLGFLGLIFFAWILAILQNSFDLRAILYLLRLLIYLVFVMRLQNALQNKSFIWRLLSFNILLLGFVQYFFLPDLRFLVYEGYDDHFYRLTSTILDPAFTGLIFVFNLNYYLWQKKKNYWLIVLFLFGLLLTYSRASYLAFAFSSLLMIFLNQKSCKKFILFTLLVFCLALPFLPKQSGGDGVNLLRTVSIQNRLNNDQEILKNMNLSQWLIGRGLFVPTQNRVVATNIPSHSHFADNLLVFLISNLGIVGTLYLLILIIKFFYKQQKPKQLVLLSSLLTHAMFSNDLTQSFIILIFLGFYLSKD
jgi:hypothetical protein